MASIMQDWLKIVFNPSFPFRFLHDAGVFADLGLPVCGSERTAIAEGRECRTGAPRLQGRIVLAAVAAPAQMIAGDMHALNTLEHQPQKIAAMEKGSEDDPRAAAAVRDPGRARPGSIGSKSDTSLGELILRHDMNGELKAEQFQCPSSQSAGLLVVSGHGRHRASQCCALHGSGIYACGVVVAETRACCSDRSSGLILRDDIFRMGCNRGWPGLLRRSGPAFIVFGSCARPMSRRTPASSVGPHVDCLPLALCGVDDRLRRRPEPSGGDI